MKNTITFLCLLLSMYAVKAQDRTIIAFLPMTFDSETIANHEAKIIQETIINGFVTSKRFTVVDRAKLEEIEKEKSLQKSEAFIDSDATVANGLNKGANYLVDGSIMSIRHSEDNKNKWVSHIVLQIRMLDVSTGEILSTETVNSNFVPTSSDIKKIMKSYFSKDEMKLAESREEHLQSASDHQDDSFNTALLRLNDNILKFTSSLFPRPADIISWDPKKKDEFVLGAGSGTGIQAGQIVDVVKASMISVGEKEVQRTEVIGSAWIIRVDDQNFSVATLIDNQKDIRKAIKNSEPIGVLIR